MLSAQPLAFSVSEKPVRQLRPVADELDDDLEILVLELAFGPLRVPGPP